MAASLRCMAVLCSLCVLPPLGRSQGPPSDQRINNPQDPQDPLAPLDPLGVMLPSAARIQDLLREENRHLNYNRMYGSTANDNEKLAIFIAAAGGTVTLMAVMYCIYNNFYPKSQYLHTPLQDDTDLTPDSPEAAPVYFQGSGVMDRDNKKMWGASTASISDTPSIINVPPSLSPPPSLVPYPPLFLSSYHLRTISARDLERSCV